MSSAGDSETPDVQEGRRSLPAGTPPASERRERRSQISAVRQDLFQGPIPPPEILEGYERVQAGAADRILCMAEQEAAHRRAMEKALVEAEVTALRWGQRFAFVLGVLGLIAGPYVAVNVPTWEGFATGGLMSGGTIIALVYAFVRGRRASKQQDRQS